MNDLELEVKLLNVDVAEIKNKLVSLGAEYQNEVIQKIYTYDCYDPIIIYKAMLSDYKITKSKNSLMKIVTFLNQLKPIFIESDKLLFKEKTNFEYLDDYILNNINNIDYKILNDAKIKNIIKNTKNRFFKWIRLRQNGNKIELTIKYIYNVDKEYNIDEVKEIEINVSSFEIANKIIEEMGYFRKKLVEKKRTSYILDNNNIEIDEWPLIPPYVEIEGKNIEKIYNTVLLLGYTEGDAKVMNTDDVYLENDINLNDYEVLTFNESIKI